MRWLGPSWTLDVGTIIYEWTCDAFIKQQTTIRLCGTTTRVGLIVEKRCQISRLLATTQYRPPVLISVDMSEFHDCLPTTLRDIEFHDCRPQHRGVIKNFLDDIIQRAR
jgi:hypothetical protein